MNRPGKSGFRARKKKTDTAEVCTLVLGETAFMPYI